MREGWTPFPHETGPLQLLVLLSIAGLVLNALSPIPGSAVAPAEHWWAGPAPLLVLLAVLSCLIWSRRGLSALVIATGVVGGLAVIEGALRLCAQLPGLHAGNSVDLERSVATTIIILTPAALLAEARTTPRAQIRLLRAGISVSLLSAAARVASGTRYSDAFLALGVGACWAWWCSTVASMGRECIRLALTTD